MNTLDEMRDLARLGVRHDWELRNWSAELRVTEDELRAAIRAVGLRVVAVRRYLDERRKGDNGSARG